MAAASKIVQAKLLARDDTRFDLPTDEASRMARAQEMGFDVDTPLYHLTKNDFDEFRLGADPSSHTGGGAVWLRDDPSYSLSAHQTGRGSGFDAEGVREVPVYIRGNKELTALEWSKMRAEGLLSNDFPQRISLAENKLLRDMGYTHVDYQGEVAVFDPKNIRSRFAKFDPAKADSADILAGVGGIAAAGGALSAMGGEARAQEPVNPDDLDPELGMSEQFDRNPLARTGFDPRAVRQLPFKMRGYKAWTSYEDSTNPGLKSIAHGFSRPFSSDDTAMILGIEALPSMDEGGAQLLMHESGHRALRMLNDTEPDLAKLVDTLRQPKTDTHGGLDGEEVLMRMLDFFGGNEDRRADTEKFFKQRTGKDIFPVIQENIDTLTQVQAFFQKKLMEQGRNPGSIEFRTPEDIAASPRQNDPAGAALSQQDGFDYGALSNVVEGSNGQRSN
jgi:hypothetical protein